jgi:isopentenyl-diphosphate Delta-isomerase
MILEHVILVDEQDNQVGIQEKLAAHKLGKLHRAVSVLIFNEKGELLLQQRAFSKYHSGGLWSNTCCGHPRPGESPLIAAQRRLFEEMGIRTDLKKSFDFIYKAPLDNGLTEYELDHVFTGAFNEPFHPNPEEVAETKWLDLSAIRQEILQKPDVYTYWFKILINRL